MSKKLFIQILEALSIKYTTHFSTSFYEENPYKNNLYGISKMLNEYGVETMALELKKEKNILFQLEAPFVAYFDHQFVLVKKVSEEEKSVAVDWFGKEMVLTIDRFLEHWSGIILLMATTESSIEPEYDLHLRKSYEYRLLNIVWILSITFILGYGLFSYTNHSIGEYLFLVISGIGLFVSYLLINKDLSGSKYADRICSLFLKSSDCNQTLKSPASQLFGIKWSSFGMGYFLVNVFYVLFAGENTISIIIYNVLALPYTVWSVWYQKFRLKAWCPLCLIIQAILWMSLLSFLIFFDFSVVNLEWPSFILVGCSYAISILLVHWIVRLLSGFMDYKKSYYNYLCLKSNEIVFLSLLRHQSQYEINKEIGLVFGNPKADKWVTIVSNPHCGPCARLHERLKAFIKMHGDHFGIQIILTSFGEEMEPSGMLLISQYQTVDKESFLSFLDLWFTKGKDNREAFYKEYHLDTADPRVLEELNAQKQWVKDSKITSTPTILLNGYLLPENYALEDLAYFVDLKLTNDK